MCSRFEILRRLFLIIALIGSFHIHLPLYLHPCLFLAAWGLLRRLFFIWLAHPWPCIALSCLFPLSGSYVSTKMVRSHGVSHHGRTSGNCGRPQSAPQNIILLASASPVSEHGRPLPNSSFQTTHVKFHSRLNKHVLSASITIILSEEEDKPNKSAHTSLLQSQDDSVLQGDVVGRMFNCGGLQEE